MAEIVNPERRAARPQPARAAPAPTRRAGKVPAIVYGDAKDPVSISLDRASCSNRALAKPGFFTRAGRYPGRRRRSTACCRARSSYHPVTDAPLHVDFMRVADETQVTVDGAGAVHQRERRRPASSAAACSTSSATRSRCAAVRLDPDPFRPSTSTGLDIGDSIHIRQARPAGGRAPTITDATSPSPPSPRRPSSPKKPPLPLRLRLPPRWRRPRLRRVPRARPLRPKVPPAACRWCCAGRGGAKPAAGAAAKPAAGAAPGAKNSAVRCCFSSASAIPGRATPRTGTISASWRWSSIRKRYGFAACTHPVRGRDRPRAPSTAKRYSR